MILPTDHRDATPAKSQALHITPLVRAVVLYCIENRCDTRELQKAVEQEMCLRFDVVAATILGDHA